MTSWLTKSLFIFLLHSCCGKLFNIEIERFGPKENVRPRSQASNNATVLMKKHETIRINFCLRFRSEVTIINIVYSNDGHSDEIQATLDGNNMGAFIGSPYDGSGKGWNLFRSSGRLPGRLALSTGPHALVLNATKADSYGIEVDNILLDISDLGLDYPTLFCSMYCFDYINYKPVTDEIIPSGGFVQKSVSTQCAEEDNVLVEVYHNTATKFEIIANIPKYLSFANYRSPFFDNCILGSPFWMFRALPVRLGTRLVETPRANLSFHVSANVSIVTVNFDFKKISPVREVDETKIRTSLRLKLMHMPRSDVIVRAERTGNKRYWEKMTDMTFTSFSNEKTWDIPEFSWSEHQTNRIKLTIYHGNQLIVVDTLLLERQNISDHLFEVYADNNVVIQTVRLGFWHQRQANSGSMTFQSTFGNKTEFRNIDSFRIYAKVPWTGGFSQVFVLFQDGRARLQLITPHGLDYIPFGSSINIGQPLVAGKRRPYSAIRRVTIDPRHLRMTVTYENGNSAIFVLKTSFTETKLTIEKCKFLKNRSNFPVMTFQSMWVNDGNADVDHVSVDGGNSRHIMSDWKELRGKSVAFFRKCISRHNTQAPDIQIRFVN